MAAVRWTSQAADDLESITELIANDSVHFARLFAIDVVAAVKRLATFPASGRIVPELSDPEFREILQGSYRIIYRTTVDTVHILTIYHGARLLDPTKL